MSNISYNNLIVWQRAMDLVVLIYRLTDSFPRSEIYGLTSQMRRASVSIPTNIAEGSRRLTRKDYRSFLANAYGSGAELETLIGISKKLNFGNHEDDKEIAAVLNEIMRMLNSMIRNLK